jgi:hypothetical protein
VQRQEVPHKSIEQLDADLATAKSQDQWEQVARTLMV